jgi:hypothetical protein
MLAVSFGLFVSLILSGCGGGGSSSTSGVDINPADRTGTGPTELRSVKLNNYHNYFIPGDSKIGTPEFEEALRQVAKRDNITFTEMYCWKNVTPQMIKALNPKAKVYRYYDIWVKPNFDPDWVNNNNDKSYMQLPILKSTIDANDWWLRDGEGQIIKNTDSNWFIDVGKPGVREEYLKNLLEKNAGKGFDGFVFDGGWFSIDDFCNGKRPKAYPTDEDWFNKAMKPFIEYICTGIHKAGYRIIVNCAGEYMSGDPHKDWYRSQIDGTVYEQGAVDWPDKEGRWLHGNIISDRINHFNQDPLEAWMANYGLRNTTPEFEQKKQVALAMYYVAIPQTQDKRNFSIFYDKTPYWDPLWDLYIGTPCNASPQKIGDYFWSRKYTQGLVLLNYESTKTVNYKLDREYHDAFGKKYSGEIQLPPHTGLILAS